MYVTLKLGVGVALSLLALTIAALSKREDIFLSRENVVNEFAFQILLGGVTICCAVLIDFITRATNKNENRSLIGSSMAWNVCAILILCLFVLAISIFIFTQTVNVLEKIIGNARYDAVVAMYCTILVLSLTYTLRVDLRRIMGSNA
jgi:heme/copper-type cytochrome/quinol oxidase subunit 2